MKTNLKHHNLPSQKLRSFSFAKHACFRYDNKINPYQYTIYERLVNLFRFRVSMMFNTAHRRPCNKQINPKQIIFCRHKKDKKLIYMTVLRNCYHLKTCYILFLSSISFYWSEVLNLLVHTFYSFNKWSPYSFESHHISLEAKLIQIDTSILYLFLWVFFGLFVFFTQRLSDFFFYLTSFYLSQYLGFQDSFIYRSAT